MNPNPSGHRPQRPLDPSQFRPQRRVFDIAPPGRTPANSTSRPVVPSRKPMVQDMSVRSPGLNAPRPMLNPHPKPQATAVNGMEFAPRRPAPLQPPPAHRVAPPIQPPSPGTVAPPKPQPSMPLPSPSPAARQPAFSPIAPPVAPPAVRPFAAAVSQSQNSDDLPANLGPVQLTDDEPVLISKHVPQDGSTKWRWIIAASIIFLILLVIFDILLDADFITLRQVPHTHFF